MAHYPTKIATCCYCGTRAALVLQGRTRHELACSACGAPLHDLKMLRSDRVQDHETVPQKRLRRSPAPAAQPQRPVKKKKTKRRKPLWARVVGEAFDVIEDIFD